MVISVSNRLGVGLLWSHVLRRDSPAVFSSAGVARLEMLRVVVGGGAGSFRTMF